MALRLALLIAADNEEHLAMLAQGLSADTFPIEDADADDSPAAYKDLMKDMRGKLDS